MYGTYTSGKHVVVDSSVDGVLQHADHLERLDGAVERRLGQPRDPHDLADRRTSVEASAHERLVHEGERLSLLHLGGCDQSSLREGNPKDPHVVRAHLMHLGARRWLTDTGHVDRGCQIPDRMCAGIHGNGLDAGNARDAPEQIFEERHAPHGVGIALLGQRHPERQDAIGAEPEIDLLHRQNRPDHQTGRDEQHQRQRDLGDDERLTEEDLEAAARHAAARLAQ